MTKVGNEWKGTNYSFDIQLKLARKNPGLHEIAFVCIKKYKDNKHVLHKFADYDNQGNIFELLVNKGMVVSKDNCTI